MKYILNFIALSFLLCSLLPFESCKDRATEDRAVRDHLDTFVTRIEGDTAKCMKDTNYWSRAEKQYKDLHGAVEQRYNGMDLTMRGEVDKLSAKYETIHKKYLACAEDMRRLNRLRGEIFGDADAGFTNVNGKNIASYYEKLAAASQAHKKTYTDADWESVNLLYQSLDDRKRDLKEKKEISKKDDQRIDGYVIKYQSAKNYKQYESGVNKLIGGSKHKKKRR